MMMFKSIAHSAVLACYGLSWVASVQLDIDLRMTRTYLYASLNLIFFTMHLTVELSEYTTGVLWMRYSALLRWVYCDFCLEQTILSEKDLEFARCFP
jgi:hypothetical protein